MEHFLIGCQGCTNTLELQMNPFAVNYNAIRNNLIGPLKLISVFFKYPIIFTAQNVLSHIIGN